MHIEAELEFNPPLLRHPRAVASHVNPPPPQSLQKGERGKSISHFKCRQKIFTAIAQFVRFEIYFFLYEGASFLNSSSKNKAF